jgi:hypothetical protein
MYDVRSDVRTAALEGYGISGTDLFCPGLAPCDTALSDRQIKLLAVVAEGAGTGTLSEST